MDHDIIETNADLKKSRAELEASIPSQNCAECGSPLTPHVTIDESWHPDGEPMECFLLWHYTDNSGKKAPREGGGDSRPPEIMLCQDCWETWKEQGRLPFTFFGNALVQKEEIAISSRACATCEKPLNGEVVAEYRGNSEAPKPENFIFLWKYPDANQSGALAEAVPEEMECSNCINQRKKNERIAELLAAAENAEHLLRRTIPVRFRDASLDDFPPEIADRVRQWWTQESDYYWCLLIIGKTGVGKTRLSYALLKWILEEKVKEFRRSCEAEVPSEDEVPKIFRSVFQERWVTALWPKPLVRGLWHPDLPAHLDATEFADLVRGKFDKDDPDDWMLGGQHEFIDLRGPTEELIHYPGLMLLDDFGTQRSTNFVDEELYRFINGRYKRCLPMVVTGNLDIDTAERDLDKARLVSRFCEGAVVRLSGNDLRKKRKAGK